MSNQLNLTIFVQIIQPWEKSCVVRVLSVVRENFKEASGQLKIRGEVCDI